MAVRCELTAARVAGVRIRLELVARDAVTTGFDNRYRPTAFARRLFTLRRALEVAGTRDEWAHRPRFTGNAAPDTSSDLEWGNFHILRHTFCSHLAMRGGAAKAIQELAGHTHLSTTMRYMHLAEGHKEQTIRLLDRRPVLLPQGGRVEAGLEAVKG